VANSLFGRNSIFPKRLRSVWRASSPLRHSLGCPQLAAPGTPTGEKPQFDKQNARIEYDSTLLRVIKDILAGHTDAVQAGPR
jgi:hypothetical protein